MVGAVALRTSPRIRAECSRMNGPYRSLVLKTVAKCGACRPLWQVVRLRWCADGMAL